MNLINPFDRRALRGQVRSAKPFSNLRRQKVVQTQIRKGFGASNLLPQRAAAKRVDEVHRIPWLSIATPIRDQSASRRPARPRTGWCGTPEAPPNETDCVPTARVAHRTFRGAEDL